jgi:SHS2 domain-containing protein
MPYEFLEHTADVMFKAWGKSTEELFVSCATALSELMADLSTILPKKKRSISVESETLEDLLFNFLNEIIYYKDAEGLIFCKYDLKIRKNKWLKVECDCFGENIDVKKHVLGIDVKAVTYHNFKIEFLKDRVEAQIILDV